MNKKNMSYQIKLTEEESTIIKKLSPDFIRFIIKEFTLKNNLLTELYHQFIMSK